MATSTYPSSPTCPALLRLIDDAIARMSGALATYLASSPWLLRWFRRLRLDYGSTKPFMVWQQPDGTIRQVDYDTGEEMLASNPVFDPLAHLGVAVAPARKEVDGEVRVVISGVAFERGVPLVFAFTQIVDAGTWQARGSARYRPRGYGYRKGTALDAGDPPEALVPALCDGGTHAQEAFRMLRRHGVDAYAALSSAARSECLLMQSAARVCLGRLRVLANRVERPNVDIPMDALNAQHYRAEAAPWITSTVTRVNAVAAFAEGGPLRDYWNRLRKSGWLRGAPRVERRRLKLRLLDEQSRGGHTLHYALATTVFKPGLLFEAEDEAKGFPGYGLGDTLRNLRKASRGAFSPRRIVQRGDGTVEDMSEYVVRVRFTIGENKTRVAFDATPDDDIADMLEPINRGLAAAGITERFFVLPAADDLHRVVFVTPAVYEAAQKIGAVPSSM